MQLNMFLKVEKKLSKPNAEVEGKKKDCLQGLAAGSGEETTRC